MNFYHVCNKCTAKWFAPKDTICCPRCGTDSTGEPMEPPWKLWTVEQVAQALQISTSKIYELKDQGFIAWIKVGGSVRFKIEDVEEYGRSCRQEGKPSKPIRPKPLRNLNL